MKAKFLLKKKICNKRGFLGRLVEVFILSK